MKRLFYSAITIALVSSTMFLDGCKKSSVDGHVLSVTTTYANGNASLIEGYQYDGQGRLNTYISGGSSYIFTYNPSSVVISGGGTITYPLNNQGYASNDGSGVGSDAYSYNSDGYLTTDVNEVNTTTNSTTMFNITNGDVTSISTDNVTTDIVNYTTTADIRDYGLHFLGKNSTPASFGAGKSSHLADNDMHNGVLYQYTYHYDSKGRVQTQIVSGNGSTSTATYTYTTN
jgi:hypothetical protein